MIDETWKRFHTEREWNKSQMKDICKNYEDYEIGLLREDGVQEYHYIKSEELMKIIHGQDMKIVTKIKRTRSWATVLTPMEMVHPPAIQEPFYIIK